MEDVNKQLQYVINRIKEIRTQKSVSQLELSVKSNLSQSFLANIEKGKKQPSVLTLLRIASALNVSPKAFLPENENISKDDLKDTIISLVRAL
ncbi:MAG: helix-turn-helix domain-containing protein [Treponema sp.]|nr:helix-turn-helix domain-containing protein [Treponema sp.]MCL2272725.1 helix-turn-helix domain-containing protein [Treponema sp.]